MSTETLPFKTELKQVLDIIIHSLYSHKDIFLRELISNASDAIDTLRFEALTKDDLRAASSEGKIQLIPDKEQGTLTIADNGIGMTRDEVIENLGTIARSGTRAFLESLKKAEAKERPDLIGQFGVGFYSAFMVADKVTVHTRHAGSPAEAGVRWVSDGQGEFSVETAAKETTGTSVILHLRDEDKEFLDSWRLRSIVKKYSDFVAHAIVMEVEKEDADKNKTRSEETLNSRQALWLRPKSEITEQEYKDFYRHISHDPGEPGKTIHYAAEGTIEFRALLYLPTHKPFDLAWGERPRGLHLYIQRVFIMDDCETLLPTYLRFVKGVVDSPDLPLNVSREMLQQSAPLEKIKNNLVGKILNTLDEWKRKDYDGYVKFYQEMSVFLKEGVNQDWNNREKLADLLLLESTKTAAGQFTTLAQYVENMSSEQSDIYYLAGDNREMLENSPYLESFKAKNWDVILLTDPIDEFVTAALTTYKGKHLKAVDKSNLDTSVIDEDKKKSFAPLLDFMKAKLPDVQDVQLSTRLQASAACLVTPEGAMGPQMERLLKRMGRGQELPDAKRILELNPEHSVVQALRGLAGQGDVGRLEHYCRLLYDQAVIGEGSKVKDPAALARRINDLILKDALTS